VTLADHIREHFGNRQCAFAERAGVDEGQLSKYLRAERGEPGGQRPSADNIARIEAAAGSAFGSAYWARLKTSKQQKRKSRNGRAA
jgi:transcriptional regulator with XRE-family HTH domain